MNRHTNDNDKVLLVEDDEKLSALIARYLIKNGFQVEVELRGDTAVQKIIDTNPDLIVLDVMLPGLDGFEVCKQVRPHYNGSILMLTAKDEDIDQIVGLELGADDYVVKPVEPRLLLARIRALLRRVTVKEKSQPVTSIPGGILSFNNLTIDANARQVKYHNKPIDLTSTEFDLLWLLASHAGNTLSREHISKNVFNVDYNGLSRSVDNKISCLRKLLGDNPHKPEGIKTIRGKGYLFVASAW